MVLKYLIEFYSEAIWACSFFMGNACYLQFMSLVLGSLNNELLSISVLTIVSSWVFVYFMQAI